MPTAAVVDIALEERVGGPSVTGYIDAVSGNRIFGWAWDKDRPNARIAIRVMASGDGIAALIADQLREDLVANGVGDGAHAFDVTLPDGVSPDDVQVLAICPESGETVELARAPAPTQAASSSAAAALHDTIARLARSQRLLYGNLQSAIAAIEELRKGKAEPAPAADAAANQSGVAALAQRIETLEAAALRIDNLLAAHAAQLPALQRRGADRVSRVLAGSAVFLAAAALVTALLR
jgi:hypothetical protein